VSARRTMRAMGEGSYPQNTLQAVLGSDLRQPYFLTTDEVAGGWRDLFPGLAQCLPRPYPIFSPDEDLILDHGYPVQLSPGIVQLRHEVERQLATEVEYRVVTARGGSADKGPVMAHRERYLRYMTAMIENTMVSDYGRGLLEVLLLFHANDLSLALSQVPAIAVACDRETGREHGEEFRYLIGQVFADLVARAAHQAADGVKRLSRTVSPPGPSPLIGVMCQDLLPLIELRISPELGSLATFIRHRLRHEASHLDALRHEVVEELGKLLDSRPMLAGALQLATAGQVDLRQPNAALQPRLWQALDAVGVRQELEISPATAGQLSELGLLLKRFELLMAVRRRVRLVDGQGAAMRLTGEQGERAIAGSSRPFDFTRPGVVDTAIRRVGLVYDLSTFTALLEEVRKKGRAAEEKALRFMYIFQTRLEEICSRRRLVLEKFLGDGAFYSSRRAMRMIAAACEIQRVYDELRHRGFPFDKGIRMAVNFSTYRLLPMAKPEKGPARFEFFGHGIVELARLTTGKSTREVDEIAEFLIHSGYDTGPVEEFLRPLAAARSGMRSAPGRTYSAWIDNHGELINEGIVLTAPYLAELQRELGGISPWVVEDESERWLVFPVDAERAGGDYFGLRYLGVARLKGLPPTELFEAAVWPALPEGAEATSLDESLRRFLLRLATGEDRLEKDEPGPEVQADLVVVTYLDDDGNRAWVFGQYRAEDDVLLHALRVPIEPPDMEQTEPVEMWLFRNRFELARLYDGLRRSSRGSSVHLRSLRERDGYLGSFLAAPHRTPA